MTTSLAAALARVENAADVIDAQIAQHKEIVLHLREENARLKEVIGAVFNRLKKLYANADHVTVNYTIIRDFCIDCGLRYRPDVTLVCQKCRRPLARHQTFQESGSFCEINFVDLSPEEWARIVSAFALGDAHVEKTE